jgi:hypothetical protein
MSDRPIVTTLVYAAFTTTDLEYQQYTATLIYDPLGGIDPYAWKSEDGYVFKSDTGFEFGEMP